MVIGIECHARPRKLLQGCDCVCLVRLSKVNPGCDLGARESKAQDAPALPQLFFPEANEALLRKQQRIAVRSMPKASVKAQHSLKIRVGTVGCCCWLPEPFSQWEKTAYGEGSLPGHLLWESTAFVGKSELGLWKLLLLA